MGNLKQSQIDDLFLPLIEQVKQPFVQIAHAAEILQNTSNKAQSDKTSQTILVASDAALRLIDGYMLSIELQRTNRLALEPVSISSILYDTAEILNDYAKAHGCSLVLHVGGKYGPVMAHKRAMQMALTTLGLSFIEAAIIKSKKRPSITLAVRRQKAGINAGVFSATEGLNNSLLKQARIMQGKVRQPLGNFESGNGAGVFIADSLFNSMHTYMKTSSFSGLKGLSATLTPSRQLSLV